MMKARDFGGPRPVSFSPTAAVVRYQTPNVDRAVAFYTRHLGFELTLRTGTGFALVSRGDLNLILSGPETSGARPMPDGRRQEPGGWNRIVLYVDSIDAAIAALRDAGTHFRNDVELGPGGRQIVAEDPDGNPIELHEPPDPKTTDALVRRSERAQAWPIIVASAWSLSSGRIAAASAVVIGLIGVVFAGHAVLRKARRSALVASALGPIGLLAGALVVLSAGGGLGTGHGLGGGVVAMTVGFVATALGALALTRPSG